MFVKYLIVIVIGFLDERTKITMTNMEQFEIVSHCQLIIKECGRYAISCLHNNSRIYRRVRSVANNLLSIQRVNIVDFSKDD